MQNLRIAAVILSAVDYSSKQGIREPVLMIGNIHHFFKSPMPAS